LGGQVDQGPPGRGQQRLGDGPGQGEQPGPGPGGKPEPDHRGGQLRVVRNQSSGTWYLGPSSVCSMMTSGGRAATPSSPRTPSWAAAARRTTPGGPPAAKPSPSRRPVASRSCPIRSTPTTSRSSARSTGGASSHSGRAPKASWNPSLRSEE